MAARQKCVKLVYYFTEYTPQVNLMWYNINFNVVVVEY